MFTSLDGFADISKRKIRKLGFLSKRKCGVSCFVLCESVQLKDVSAYLWDICSGRWENIKTTFVHNADYCGHPPCTFLFNHHGDKSQFFLQTKSQKIEMEAEVCSHIDTKSPFLAKHTDGQPINQSLNRSINRAINLWQKETFSELKLLKFWSASFEDSEEITFFKINNDYAEVEWISDF